MNLVKKSGFKFVVEMKIWG